jgi:hypothetical protein
LGVDNKVDRRLGRCHQVAVVGHGVGFAQNDRADAVRVHRAGVHQIAGGERAVLLELHAAHEVRQATLNSVLVLAFFVGLASAQEWQQRHPRRAIEGFRKSTRICLAGAVAMVEAPTAVRPLM